MLLITTIDMVMNMTEADCRALSGYTVKDRIIVLSKAGAMMPVAMFQIMSSLKCKPEIIEINIDDEFSLGYTIGRLTGTVKNTEKITILTDREFDSGDKNIIKVSSLAGAKGSKASVKADAKGSKASIKAGAKGSKASDKAGAEKVSRMPKAAAVKAEKDKAPGAKRVSKNTSGAALWAILGKSAKMKPYKDFVLNNEEALRGAILSATDAEITFKFQLQINFGSDGVAVWEILYKRFEEIQKQVKAL